MTSVASEYFKIYSEYFEKYGEKTAVLMQIGSFFEVMGIDNETEKIGNAEELSRILNIILTRKNKKILQNSMQNPLMLGFPCLALSKYIPVLLGEDYTVVIVDQTKTGLSVRRAVTDVISPSTYIDSSSDDNYLVLVYVDKHQHIGMSAISVLTGNSVVHECYSDPNDKDLPLDDALGFIKQYRPREVVLAGALSRNLLSYLELDNIMCHKIETHRNCTTAYQNAVLGCAFENKSKISNIEYLDLERMPHALYSYVLLIEFVNAHNPMLLRRMSKPDLFVHNDHLVLSTSTLDQLNVTSQVKSKHTLFNVVNKCSTKAGKRLLQKRLAAPMANAQELRKMYDQIDEFGTLFINDKISIEQMFKKIADIERLQRRLTVGIMTPGELANLVASYELMLDLDSLVRKKRAVHISHMKDEHRSMLQEFVGLCKYVFDLDSMPACDAETAAFNTGIFSEIDGMKIEIQYEMNAINDLLGQVTKFGVEGAKIEHMQNSGYYITVSSMRAKKIPPNCNIAVKHNKAVARVTSQDVDAANRNIQGLSNVLKAKTRKRYTKTLELLSSYSSMFKHTTYFVSCIDIIKSNYSIKELYNYCRPDVVNDDVPSFVDAEGLRHAVMERIDDGNEYVPNDISLGLEHSGIVLYSMNSCGKTSLLKALGLSVILAQAGCFVPASKFTIRPFKSIMTRILSRDNIMKGQSSFVAEMSELRAILKRAVDPSTLVLADEITHGTEHTSGSAIFVSSVEALAEKKVNFLFTTHLHSVYPFVRSIDNVRTCHLSVTFSANGTKSITFERKLKDGPGGSIYGLEVCEYLDMDTKFLARAFQIRDKITPDKEEKRSSIIKVSKYNRNKIIKCCESCGYSPRLTTDQPLHTHHIRERHLADENGMIDGVHMDSISNLAVLCERCHRQAHAN